MRLQNWLSRDDGAVTTDWVVLTGMAILFAGVAVGAVRSGAFDVARDTQTRLNAVEPNALGTLGWSQ